MRRFKKTIIIASALIGGYLALALGYQFRGNKNIQPYIEYNLPKIIQIQEQRVGIKHFGIPNIRYRSIPSLKAGEYVSEGDTIYLYTNASVTHGNSLENILAKIFTLGTARDVNEWLMHELGHFYVDKLSENLGLGNFHTGIITWRKFIELAPEGTGKKLIEEGIAEYFRLKTNGQTVDFKNTDWPIYRAGYLDDSVFYRGGYHLVRPIIEKYGKDGIEYLIRNPPMNVDLIQLDVYQRRVLKALSSQTS